MKPLAGKLAARIGMAGAIASAMLFVLPVFAQDSRLSLADRVSLLEQRAQNKDQSSVAMVNQLQQMQAQLQQMQGQIEELQHQLQQLQDKSKDQYIDLDSRMGRLEAASKTGTAPASGSSTPAAAGAATTGAATAGPAASANAATPAPAASGAAKGDKPLSAADNAAAQAAYDTAFKTLRGGDYVGASREFRQFIEQYPDHPLTPNAFYWLGESYYVTTNYQVALQAFQHLLSQFPQSEKAPDALLKVGYCQFELKQVPAAKATLNAVISKYPTSKAASLAKERLGRIQQAG
jgi:tol-pal system protein YbgF